MLQEPKFPMAEDEAVEEATGAVAVVLAAPPAVMVTAPGMVGTGVPVKVIVTVTLL